MAARLKVFCWSDGLHAYTVAASSRAKALATWGFNRDLFKDGEARQIQDGADHDRALASPGVTVKRGLGASAGEVSALTPSKPRRRPPGPSQADLKRVARLQDEIAALTEDRQAKIAAIEVERAALAKTQERLSAAFETRRAVLEERLKTARARLERR